MNDKYRILHLEDVATDAELVAFELKKSKISFEHCIVSTEVEYRQSLEHFSPDIILCDHSLGSFSSREALNIFIEKKLNIPFILITATLSDEVATSILMDGADDYFLKDRLKRLPSAIKNAIERCGLERERKLLTDETAKKEAQSKKTLCDLSDKLLLATKTAGIGIWEYYINEGKFLADDVLLSLYGITLVDFKGSFESWLQYVHPDDRTRISHEFKNALINHADFDTEFRNVWPDGSVHFIKGVAVMQWDSLGNPLRLVGTNQDITVSKLASQEMKRLNDRLMLATDSAGLGIWDWDIVNNQITWDDGMHSLYKIKDGKLGSVYEAWTLRLHPEDTLNVNEDLRLALSGEKEYDSEFRIIWSDASVHYIKATGSVERDDAGNAIRMIGTNKEITHRKKIEKIVTESEARYRAFFESSMDGILLTTTDGEIISANPAACEIFKMTEDEMRASGRTGLTDFADPRLELLLQERQRSGRARGEITLVRKDGSKFPAELTSSVFRDAHGQERTSMIVRDITDRKAAEEKDIFQAKLLNTIGQAAISTDTTGEINYWNKAAEQMYGWSANEVMGKKIELLVPAKQSKKEVDEIMQKLAQGNAWSGEFDVQQKDGTIFPVFVTNSPVYDQCGQLTGIIGISTDITERKNAGKAINESEAFNRGVLDSMSSHLAVINQSGTIVKVNKSWETFALNNGATSLDACSVGANYFKASTTPADEINGISDPTIDGIKKVLSGDLNEFYLEYPCHSPFEERWFYLRVKKFEGDEPLALIEHQYITERKKAEQKVLTTSNALQQKSNDLDKIMDSSVDVICTINEEGKFVNVSAAAERLWYYKPGELIGKRYLDLVFYEDVEKTTTVSKQIMSGLPVTLFENRYVRRDGSIVPLLWSAKWDPNDRLMFCIARDATEKKRLEKAFEIERERYNDMFLHAPSCIGILKGETHVYEMVNTLYLQLIGKKDVIGKSVKEVLPEVVEQGFIEILDNVYKTGKTFTANETLVKLDRSGNGTLDDVYVDIVYQAYRNNVGTIEGIFFFTIDVTEQVLSRKKIEESEYKYRQIVETAQEGIWIIDESNKTTFVNKKMTEIMGYSYDEMIGRTNLSFKNEEGIKISLEQIERRKAGIKETHDSSFITKSGKLIWTYISTNPLFDEAGNYKGALAMVTDITDRKIMEQRLAHSESTLKEAQALAYVGNWEIDLVTNNELWSDELYKILGYDKDSTTPSMDHFLSLIHPDDVDFVREQVVQSAKTLKGAIYEYRMITRDGLLKHCHSESKFEFDKDNQPIRLYGFLRDITIEKLAEIERTKMIKDIVQRNKELEQFTYIVSHNLRAPVANIIGLADGLSDPTYPESLQKEFLSQLSVSISKLDDVTRDLNNVLLVKQKVNDVKEEVNLTTIVNNISLSIQNLIQQYDVTIETDFTEVNTFLSIKTFIYSILYNLISNSIKYRSPGKAPVISIRTYKTSDTLELVFSDNGLGIDMKRNEDKVFGLYKRFHLHIEGKGLGLFMTKSQIETLGGSIEVSSEINNGATFKIYLPLSTK